MWMTVAAESGHLEAEDNPADFEARIGKEAVARGREMAVKCISIGLVNCPWRLDK